MGRMIKPSEIKTQVDTMTTVLKENVELLTQVFTATQSFSQENELQGEAWTGMKDQVGAHDAVIHGLLYLMDGLMEAGSQLVVECGEEELDEEVLESQLKLLQDNLGMIEDHIAYYQNRMQNEQYSLIYSSIAYDMIRNYQQMQTNVEEKIRVVYEKLAEIDRIDQATSGLTASVEGLMDAARQGLLYLSGSWNGTGFLPAMGRNLAWMYVIDKAQLDNPVDIYQELKTLGMTDDEIKYLNDMGITLTKSDIKAIKETKDSKKILVSVNRKALFFEGKIYPVYVPDAKEVVMGSVWELDGKRELSEIDFNWAAGVLGVLEGGLEEIPKSEIRTADKMHIAVTSNISSNDVNVSKAAGLSILNGVNSFLSSALSECDVHIVFESSSNGGKRVIMSAGTSSERKKYKNFNYDVSINTFREYSGVGPSASAKNLYQYFTGNEVPNNNKAHTLYGELDSRHKEDDVYGYLSYDDSGKLLYTPIVYPGDKAYIAECSYILGFNPEPIYDFSDKLATPCYAGETRQKLIERAMRGK